MVISHKNANLGLLMIQRSLRERNFFYYTDRTHGHTLTHINSRGLAAAGWFCACVNGACMLNLVQGQAGEEVDMTNISTFFFANQSMQKSFCSAVVAGVGVHSGALVQPVECLVVVGGPICRTPRHCRWSPVQLLSPLPSSTNRTRCGGEKLCVVLQRIKVNSSYIVEFVVTTSKPAVVLAYSMLPKAKIYAISGWPPSWQ